MMKSPLPVIQKLMASHRLSFLSGVHSVAKGVFLAQGFVWEERHCGEGKLGYWKKVLRKRDQRQAYPKRFVLIPGLGDSPLSWHAVTTVLLPVLKQHFDE